MGHGASGRHIGGNGNKCFTAGTGLTSSPSLITVASGTLIVPTVPVAAANGGTGLAAGTSGGIPYYSARQPLADQRGAVCQPGGLAAVLGPAVQQHGRGADAR